MSRISIALSPILEDLNPWWREPGHRKVPGWPVRRGVHQRLLDQLLRLDDRRAQVLLGPRQVGKTTLLKQLADALLDRRWPARNLTYFDFEDFRLPRPVEPEEIAGLRPSGADPNHPQILLLDEVHHLPRWDRWLKYAVDNEVARIVVTDSAASLLREGGLESGYGRWVEVQLEGLTFREFATLGAGPRTDEEPTLGDKAQPARATDLDLQLLERYFDLGGFPAHATADDVPLVRERLRGDVVDRAIRRDLVERIGEPERLRTLFVYLIQHSGSEQNAAKRAADLGVDPRTVARWIDLLQNTFLLRALPRGETSAKASAQLRGAPKLYAADHGLVTAFAQDPDDVDVRSKVFEAVVYRHLREVERARDGRLTYLRWGNALELDFLLTVGSDVFAIEVTKSKQPKPEKRKALQLAADRAGATRALLVHGGVAEGEVEGIAFVPIGAFLGDPWTALTGGGS